MVSSTTFFSRIGLLLLLVSNLAFAISLQNIQPVHKVKLDTLVIEKIDVIDHGTKLSWYAKVKNIGKTIQRNQLEISGYQLIGNRQVSKAGEKLLWNKRFKKNQLINFTKQNWQRAKDATALKIVVKNLQTKEQVSKIIAMPKKSNKHTQNINNAINSPAGLQNAGILNKKPKLQVMGASYKGRGAFEVKIKNIGERGFMPNEIEIRPIYYIKNKPPMIGKIITNQSAINVNKWRKTFSSYLNVYDNGMSECAKLDKLVLEITNKVTNQRTDYNVPGVSVAKLGGEVGDIDLEGSKVTYYVTNTGEITTKFNIRTLSFSIYKWKTEPVSNIPDYIGTRIKTLNDLFYTSITLKPGESGSVTIGPDRVNNEIKRQYSGMKKNTPYMAQYFQLELFFQANPRCANENIYFGSQASFTQSTSNSGFAIIDRR